MKIRPLDDRIAVKLDAPVEKTKNGIIIPEKAQARPLNGEVVGVGPGAYNSKKKERKPIRLEVGQRIMFTQSCGEVREVDGENILFMRSYEVLGIFKDE